MADNALTGAVHPLHVGEPIGTVRIYVPRLERSIRVFWPPYRRKDYVSPCNCSEVYYVVDPNEARAAIGLEPTAEPRCICACDFVEVREFSKEAQ